MTMMMMQTTMKMSASPQVSLRPKLSMGAKARAPLRAARRSHVVLAADTVVIGLAADSGCGKSYVRLCNVLFVTNIVMIHFVQFTHPLVR